ncbi:hypothetical protein AGMMS49949_09390 [Alphaproteobacteria bacterium]|nr:hypothetical protein AGMMS49949_09390 [Alphaproteobacteria bacterium]
MLKYDKITKKPVTFQRLFGVNLKDFEKILKKVEKIWMKEVVAQDKGPGRNRKCELSERLWMLLL